ncbi:MAG: VWA domain-containing protein [Candidatus Heimdallarchaeota archaeon]|nr:VWA domain-containing protein [Candidatus Heimdallarchaeota archaeon]
MPHRIHVISRERFTDPLMVWRDPDFVFDFADAASVLQKWRDPRKGQSSREALVLGMALENAVAVKNIQHRLLVTPMEPLEEEDLIRELEILEYIGNNALPDALLKVNMGELQTREEIEQFIQRHLKGFEGTAEYKKQLTESLRTLEELTDIEITDRFGHKMRIKREEVMDFLGSQLGNWLARQLPARPVNDTIVRPRGKIHKKKTFEHSIFTSQTIPPKSIDIDDIVVMKKDRNAQIYLIVDTSQSMRNVVQGTHFSRLEGALLTSLAIFYYFKRQGRTRRTNQRAFRTAVVPISKTRQIITSEDQLERFLLTATAKGRTPMSASIKTAIEHAKVKKNTQNRDVHLIIVTDGRPNELIPGYEPTPSQSLINYFEEERAGEIDPVTRNCYFEINSLLRDAIRDQSRTWKVSYFIIGSERLKLTDLYRDTRRALRGITYPIVIDPSRMDVLAKTIVTESMRLGQSASG